MRWLNAARSERPSDEDDEEALKDLVESGLRLIFKKYLKKSMHLAQMFKNTWNWLAKSIDYWHKEHEWLCLQETNISIFFIVFVTGSFA